MKIFKNMLVVMVMLLLSVLFACGEQELPKLEEVTFSNMVTSLTKGEELEIGFTAQENAVTVFVSSDPNIATVENNKITAVGIGSFTLKVTVTLGEESKKYEFTIEVKGAEYLINYQLNGGTNPTNAPSKYQEGKGATLPTPTKEGYEFLGWSKEAESTTYITEITTTESGNVTVYANWKEEEKVIEKYTITYELEGGINPSDAPTEYEKDKGVTLPVPTKEGYEFLGWSKEEGSTAYITGIAATETGNVTVYANWKAKMYTITYELDGGTNPSNAPTEYQETVGATLPTPTKEGYEFLGWSKVAGASEYVTAIAATEKGNITLYANWEEIILEPGSFAITYVLDGGTNPNDAPNKYQEGTAVTLPVPTKVGFDFLGWSKEEGSTSYITEISATETGNVKVYANWKAKMYTITYELDGGTNPSNAPTQYQVGTGATLPTPQKSGYLFLGWSKEAGSTAYVTGISATETGDVKFYANWVAVYTITYELDGGANPSVAPTQYEKGKGVALPIPSKAGFKFLGWSKEAGSTTYITSIAATETGNVTVYANWIEVYTINYELGGGINPSGAPTQYEKGKGATLPTPEKAGFKFLGWSKEQGSTTYITSIATTETGNVRVYANWEAIMYTITYELDGGTNPNNAPTQYQETVGVALPTPEKAGYNFIGWSKEQGSTTYITSIATTEKGNLTLYANWKAVYTITYELDGGTNASDAPTKYQEGTGVALPKPTKSGFKFLGWSKEQGSTTYISTISATETGNITLYANWEESSNAFTITYELNGGAWEWTVGTVTAPADGIDSVSNLPEIFMADFYTYLFLNDLLDSSKVASTLRVSNWAGFTTKYGDPVAWYNATTGGYNNADGYSELFFDSVNGYEAVGGFLGTSPYKEKYANLTKHLIQLTTIKYPTLATTAKGFKGAAGFVLDGYFYGTQGLLATSKDNYATFNALRATIPTPTVGYEGTTSSTNAYVVTEGEIGATIQLVAPVKEGYMFMGWYTNAELTGEKVTSATSDCKVYASWYNLNGPAPTYKINYVLNGGTNSNDAPTQFIFGEGATLTKPSRSGYTFAGWSTDANGQNIITEIPAFTNSDITVYANWIEGEEVIYTITYNYTEGKLPTYHPATIDELIEYVFTSYYDWLKPTDSYATFKSKVIAQWVDGQSQGDYKFYKSGGKDIIDADYFCNAPENFEEWNAWFTVFDSLVTAANGQQNAWNSYVGILRLGQLLKGTPPSTWKDSFNTTLINATNIPVDLVTEYKPGDAFTLPVLTIDDGRTFLGWYDQQNNKVDAITASTSGNLVLTAKWSEAIPVESFTVTNSITKLLKLSTHQLTWEFGPTNATNKKLTFKSSDPSIFTVSETGLITAVKTGTAKLTITVHGNTALNKELDIEVYVDPYIDGIFIDESYVVAGKTIQLNATLYGINSNNLVWKSNNPTVATVDSDGNVLGVSEGIAEIVVAYGENQDIKFTFYVTVFNEDPTGILKLLVDSHNSEIFIKNDLLIGLKLGSEGAYITDIIGSVSKLLFEDYVVHDDYYLSNPSNKSTLTGSGKGGIDFITVHYAADMPYSPTAMFNGGKNLASWNANNNSNGTQSSWHYGVGNDGIWAAQSESSGAWHAGSSKKMTWTDSGLTTSQVGTDLYTTDVTLGNDGYFYIKGVKTSIKNTTSSTKLNGMGLGVKIEGTKVYLGGHYYNDTYKYISSTGGNNNSIGMETSVREGSDLWLTWQYTAQLCAKLLLKYELPLNRLVGHHFFSGKWCPQPMLENDLEIWYEFVELTRQEMELYDKYSNYTLSFSSSSPYLKANGRISELPDYPECVTYTVTYSNGSTTKSVTFSTIIPGALE